jgi:hypothetical protein
MCQAVDRRRGRFDPSLIWIQSGERTAGSVTFPVAKTFESHGVHFVHSEATRIDADAQRVETSDGPRDYDYLVIATGYRNDFDVVPGIGPGGNAYWITDLEGRRRRRGLGPLPQRPGPGGGRRHAGRRLLRRRLRVRLQRRLRSRHLHGGRRAVAERERVGSRPPTSPHRSAARSRRARRTSATSRPSASWTPATTASSSWPTTCCPRASTA